MVHQTIVDYQPLYPKGLTVIENGDHSGVRNKDADFPREGGKLAEHTAFVEVKSTLTCKIKPSYMA